MSRTTLPLGNLTFDSKHDEAFVQSMRESAEPRGRWDEGIPAAQAALNEARILCVNMLTQRVHRYKEENREGIEDIDLAGE
mgnify:CR=1 FL=1|tara:strand:+ start:7375 stop:7617 length:243 start_codon:yes stop_codon:yes gene_type:complete